MKRALRFQLRSMASGFGAVLGFGAIVLMGRLIVPEGIFLGDLFDTYYSVYRYCIPIFSMIFSTVLTSTYFHLALSFGCRRRDYFWGFQGFMLLSAAASSLLFLVWEWLTLWLKLDSTLDLQLGASPSVMAIFALLCLALQCVGGLSGFLVVRSRWMYMLVMVGMGVASGAGTIMVIRQIRANMTDLPPILAAVCVGVILVTEPLLWRSVHRTSVRL